MTAVEIIDEIKRLPPAEQAHVARLMGKMNRKLTGDELGELAAQLAGETDDAKAQELQERIVAGFYGEELSA